MSDREQTLDQEVEITAPSDAAAPEDDGAAEPTPDELIATLTAERDSYQDQFTRARADYQNLRRRVESDQATARQQAARDILLQLVPLVDDFDRAMASAPTSDEGQSWVSGTRMVGRKLLSVLERYGVRRYESVGSPFDPKRHEAVATDGDGSTVLEAYQEGYLLGDQVLRPAMVRLGSAEPVGDVPDGDGPVA